MPSLLKRKKWYVDRRHIQVGDLVLIVDQNVARGRWPVSYVDEVYPGKDGITRSAQVRNKDGVYHRPISKLYVVEESNLLISDTSGNDAGDVPASTAPNG